MKEIKKGVCKFLSVTNAVFESKWFYLVMLPLAAVFVAFYSYTTSPFYVNDGMDSCVFKSMGLAILKGKTPYVDLFDHKGPILYFINAFGQWLIPGRMGIFILQIIAETIIFFFLYKTIRLFLSGTVSIIVFVVTLLIYGVLYQEGNQCEEWILLAVAPSIYYTISVLLGKDCKVFARYFGVVLGLMFGWAFFIRPNDAVSFIGGCITGLFIYQLFLKNYKHAVLNAVYFSVVFICISLPIVVYFAIRDALPDLYYGMIQHNALYAGGFGSLLTSCIAPVKLTFFLMIVIMCVLAYNCQYKIVLWGLIPVTVFAWVITGTNFFPHYLISFIPLIMLFGVFLFCQKNITNVVMSLTVIYCSSYASEVNYIGGIKHELKWRYKSLKHSETSFQIYDYKNFYYESKKLFDNIPIEEQDSIWNYNLMWWDNYSYFSIFWHNGVIQCNRVPYYPMNMVDSKLRTSESIEMHKPLWLVLTHDYDKELLDWLKWDNDYKFIDENYLMVARTDTTICDIKLYKKK